MRKELLDEGTRQQVIDRIAKLQPTGKGLWGSMTVNEMMFHCSKINNGILKSRQPDNKPTLKQKLLKIIGLRIIKEFPKGVKTGSRYLNNENEHLDFNNEQRRLIESIVLVADHRENIYGNHPFFGPLKTAEWRRFVWMHTDHHLRQFGV